MHARARRAAAAHRRAEVKQRLRLLADRYTGAKVIHMRQDAVPWAYRVFSRQVGIDPDSDRTPVEALAVERLRHGGLKSENLVDDALTIAIAETGVPVFVLDAAKVEGELGLRLARAGRAAGRAAPAVGAPAGGGRRSPPARARARATCRRTWA